MSGYFDGLMRASGLPLGAAPVIGPALRAAQGLELIQAQPAAGMPASAPQPASAVRQAPDPPARPLAAKPALPMRPKAPAAVDSAAPTPPARHADTATPDTPRKAEPAHAPVGAAPLLQVPERTPERPSAATAQQQGVSRERLIQAAMRWIAAEPGPVAPEPMRVTSEPGPIERNNFGMPARTVPEPEVAEVLILADAPRSAAAAAAEWLPALPPQAPRAAAPDPGTDAGLQVSIGAIHLRVDAPQAQAQQAIPAPRHTAPQPSAAAGSGLSRRALRRL